MRYAETGYNLEIDLSSGNIERVATDPRDMELYLGGQGTAAKILWDRVGPEVDPFSEDNLLIFSAGLLHATPVPSATRASVDTISAQTGLYSHSLFGGFWGPELKHAGYDKIILRGKAKGLVYLWIHNDKVEIRDASHLAGKGTMETAECLKKELKDAKVQVAAIGLAGENRVYMSSIEHYNSSASRGVGHIMGDKRVKAIALRGTKDVYVAKPAELFDLCNRQYKVIYDKGSSVMTHSHNEAWHTDVFAWGFARERRKGFWNKELEEEWAKVTDSVFVRYNGCYNCSIDCHATISYPGRRSFSYKCYGKLTYAMAAYQDVAFNYDIMGLTQEYGLDSFSTPQVLAFACELYEAGILTDKDLPDFPEDSGKRFFYLLEKIVRREGVGDALANGVYWAARQIGKGAEEYDHNTTKKFEQVPLKLGALNYPYFLMYATGAKMNITQIEGSFPQNAIPDKERRKAFVDKWEAAPDKFKKIYMEWEPRTQPPIDAAVAIADWNETMHYIDDSVGICAFVSAFKGQFNKSSYHINNYPEFISLASGLELDQDKLWETARRNRTLIRAINNRRGMRREDEKPPHGHWKQRLPDIEKQLIDEYYKFKGWNEDGIPTKQELDRLGLGYVSQDFIKRGILTDDKASPAKETSA
ncbi:MAG: aldehyde dehydrogenase [Chloroflexi bacterium]|jgi:aldehyde:ferredoxin oxidoreductase|nr:aldehyde dehydrogenase [Chloroflexota bacterium]MBT7081428.1 aldehyde dehydrogenase [Chloroflexota bacterium]